MGPTYSVLEQSFPEATWSVNDKPDLAGKVILVTGAFSDKNICVRVCMFNVNAGVRKKTVKVSIQPLYPSLGLIGIQQLRIISQYAALQRRSKRSPSWRMRRASWPFPTARSFGYSCCPYNIVYCYTCVYHIMYITCIINAAIFALTIYFIRRRLRNGPDFDLDCGNIRGC